MLFYHHLITTTGKLLELSSLQLQLSQFLDISNHYVKIDILMIMAQSRCSCVRSQFYESICPGVFLGKSDLKICSKFTGEHTYRSVILITFQSIFIEIALRHGCSPVNLLPIFITPFSKNTFGALLLVLQMRVAKEAKLLKLLTFLKELVQERQEISFFKEPECIYTFPVK